MAKKGGPNRALEAIHKLSLDRSFRKDVKDFRANLHIPTGGYANKIEANRARTSFSLIDNTKNAIKAVWPLMDKYKLPPTYRLEMLQYLKYDLLETDNTTAFTRVAIQYPDTDRDLGDFDKKLSRSYLPFVKVYIFDASSSESVLRVIKKNWSQIKRSIGNQGGVTSRVRTARNKDRDYLISTLSEKSKDQLCKEFHLDSHIRRPKAQIIKDVLQKEFGFKNITEEIVRKNAGRKRK